MRVRALGWACHPSRYLPSDNAINEIALFGRSAAKVDARRLDRLVPHQVGKECDVIELRQEVLGEAMSERVRIDNSCVDAVLFGKHLQLVADTTCRDALAKPVAEEIAACHTSRREPLFRLCLEAAGDVETTQLATLAVEVEESRLDVFHLDLQKFRDAGTRRAQEAHDEIPIHFSRRFEFPAEEAVVCIADDVLEKVLLLNLDELHFQSRLLNEVEISVQGL